LREDCEIAHLSIDSVQAEQVEQEVMGEQNESRLDDETSRGEKEKILPCPS